jgi:hypothetical protein
MFNYLLMVIGAILFAVYPPLGLIGYLLVVVGWRRIDLSANPNPRRRRGSMGPIEVMHKYSSQASAGTGTKRRLAGRERG